MVKIKYVGKWQSPEIKDVDKGTAVLLVNTGNWVYVHKNKNGNSNRNEKRSTKSDR